MGRVAQGESASGSTDRGDGMVNVSEQGERTAGRRFYRAAPGSRHSRVQDQDLFLTELARFATFARFVKLIVDAPARFIFAFNKIAMEYELLFQNWNQAWQDLASVERPLGKVA